jgi:hypothetical protein
MLAARNSKKALGVKMKIGLIRALATCILLTTSTGLFAQNLPSSDNSDLWLFVSNGTTSTFAEDTGISISSLLPTSNLVPNAQLSTAVGVNFEVQPTFALEEYLAANESATLEWAVEGINFSGLANTDTPGAVVGIASATSVPGNETFANMMFGNRTTIYNWGEGFNEDIQNLLYTYTAGGSVYQWSNNGVWGDGYGDVAGSTNLYGGGPNQAGTAVGEIESLYGVTGNGSRGTVQSYVLSQELEFTAEGTLFAYTPTTTPLPAAGWLLLSGLGGLGIAGLKRRAA